ncbi:hypothetical protein, partial [Rugamonas violacea]|uniref:hypothetical protein n=1 Tax=Rugamonas sp. CCM 8940 TaxID=2765359 RepID=UPI001F26B181
ILSFTASEETAALSSNIHTYRLLIVKELIRCCLQPGFEPLTKRFVCQLRRRKSMQRFGHFVNPVFPRIALKNFPRFTLRRGHLRAPFCGEANYSKGLGG